MPGRRPPCRPVVTCLAWAALIAGCVDPASPSPPIQNDRAGIAEISGGGFFASPAEQQEQADRRLARELTTTLETLPGVLRARVHISTTPAPLFGPERTPSKTAAVVVLRDNSRSPNAAELAALVSAAVPALSPENVRLVLKQPPISPPTETVRVGPIEVTSATAPTARLIIGALLGLCAAAAVGLVVAGILLRRLRSTTAP